MPTNPIVTIIQSDPLRLVDSKPANLSDVFLVNLLPALVVGVISLVFQNRFDRRMKRLESQIARSGEYFNRKLQAHEEFWPLIANCVRAQESIANARKNKIPFGELPSRLSGARKAMKNHFFDHEIYFSQHLSILLNKFDDALQDPKTFDVSEEGKKLKNALVEEIEKELYGNS